MAYDVKTLLFNISKGIPMNVGQSKLNYHGDVIVPNIASLDLEEIAQIVRDTEQKKQEKSEELRNQNKAYKLKQQELAKQKEDEDYIKFKARLEREATAS